MTCPLCTCWYCGRRLGDKVYRNRAGRKFCSKYHREASNKLVRDTLRRIQEEMAS